MHGTCCAAPVRDSAYWLLSHCAVCNRSSTPATGHCDQLPMIDGGGPQLLLQYCWWYQHGVLNVMMVFAQESTTNACKNKWDRYCFLPRSWWSVWVAVFHCVIRFCIGSEQKKLYYNFVIIVTIPLYIYIYKGALHGKLDVSGCRHPNSRLNICILRVRTLSGMVWLTLMRCVYRGICCQLYSTWFKS